MKHYYTVEGIQCSQCLKKLKQLSSQIIGVDDMTIDMSRHMLLVTSNSQFKGAELLAGVEALGFKAREIQPDLEKEHQRRSQSSRLLARLGIAGALSGNIMLLSYASYLGAPEEYFKLFSYLSGFLFVPVLLYSASPIILNSWNALVKKKASIDMPLALALLLGSLFSYINLFKGSEAIYFDSLAALVFLILCSRYIVFRFQQNYLAPVSLSDLLPHKSFMVWQEDKWEVKEAGRLQAGDLVQIEPGYHIPGDGKLETGEIFIDNSLLTGESDPVGRAQHDELFAGARCVKGSGCLRLQKGASESRISGIIEKLNQTLSKESQFTQLTDRMAHYFTFGVFGVGFLFLLFYGFVDLAAATNRTLALFVISCPCAIAVTSPLIFRLSAKTAMTHGFLVKKTEALEALAHAEVVVFDKTGTLTQPTSAQWLKGPLSNDEKQIIFAMEKESTHPYARVIVKSLQEVSGTPIQFNTLEEIAGYGVNGSIKGDIYELKRSQIGSSHVGFFKNGLLINEIDLDNTYNEEVAEEVRQLREQGYEIQILTGDSRTKALELAKGLNIDSNHVFAEVSPEWKADYIEKLSKQKKVIYVGDGLNDSLAIAQGAVGISMEKSVDATFLASNIHIMNEGIRGLAQLFKHSKKTIKTIRRLLVLSFSYNLIFGVFALSGFISPLLASVLMPLSSLTMLSLGVLSMKGRF